MIGAETVQSVSGRVDRDGRLVEAEPRLLELNARAGGSIGRTLAIPQVATLARLAARLGIVISRGVVAAAGDVDVDLWVRAEPDGDGVRLEITGWSERTAWQPPASVAEREQDLARTVGDWLWETNATLQLTFISAEAGASHGFDAATVLRQPLTQLFVLGEAADGDLPLLQGLAMQERFVDQPATIRASGRSVRLSGVPRRDSSGGFAGFFGAAVMVAPPEAEQEIGEDDPLGMLPSRLDKALRAPLGRIIANADSINAQSEGPLRQDYADYAADIASAGRHLMGLVDDLVDLQAIERADFTITSEPLDLADVARRAAGLLGVRASDARVRIERPGFDDALPATGEFRRALQVLVNLIGNAVRYAPPESAVAVTSSCDGEFACVEIADTGTGIAPEDQARIFDKFERVDPREPGGSGLGLYISRRLARAMGGDVTVASTPGEGARFTFSLPYREG